MKMFCAVALIIWFCHISFPCTKHGQILRKVIFTTVESLMHSKAKQSIAKQNESQGCFDYKPYIVGYIGLLWAKRVVVWFPNQILISSRFNQNCMRVTESGKRFFFFVCKLCFKLFSTMQNIKKDGLWNRWLMPHAEDMMSRD